MTPTIGQHEAPIDVDRARRLIERSRPHGRGYWLARRWGPLAAIGVSIVLMWQAPAEAFVAAAVAPVAILAAVLALSMGLAAAARRRRRLHGEAVEAVQTRQWRRARSLLEKLLSKPVDDPLMRTAALLSLAEVAQRDRRHDAAAAICEEALAGPIDETTAQLARIRQAMSLLAADRLTDANELLDRLRAGKPGEPVRSLTALAVLYRQVRTGHYDQAVEEAPRVARLARRSLGFRAAEVYALQAAALNHTGQTNLAQRYFDCATRLSPAARLYEQTPILAELCENLEPARNPLWP